MKIRIKYLADIDRLPSIKLGDWQDLRAAEDIDLRAGEFRLIPLGVAMEIPKGFEAFVVPRSSTFKKYHIIQTNSVGIIDNSYNGDNDQWFMPVLAMDNTHISKNDRICQFRVFSNQDEIEWEVVETLGNENRGGFGSTGVQ